MIKPTFVKPHIQVLSRHGLRTVLQSGCPKENAYSVPIESAESFTKQKLRTLSTDQSSRRLPHRKKSYVQPTASSAAIQAQVAPSLGAPVSSRTIRRRLTEGHLVSWCPLRVLLLTPPSPTAHRRLRLEWCRA
ncbi:transposable element Tcb2 transposase [Trichonephila clavipes]|uniref:Transposable element Tcb2 transposase n=1 Tax=Trichonephila clavipes TaxID=2585209 RepID=A0A8X6V9X3_TRICX|nr:transposable element Tcb2 transposase [Trichonephila clavipes]